MAQPRRLAAIMAIDVVGYSRLMGMDEAGTVRAVREHRDAARPIVTLRGGRIVKTMGDGLLLEFPSVVAAVECGIAIQKLMIERNADVSEARRIVYRIGVSLGDVLIDGDDILGEGVNIAARLEGICEPGGITISGTAYEHTFGRIHAEFVDLGEQALKNIGRPVRAYAIDLASAHASGTEAYAAQKPSDPPSVPAKDDDTFGLAVLPDRQVAPEPPRDQGEMVEDMADKTVFQQSPQGSLRPGVRLNDMFEIERLIAEGGMGEVYKGVAVASGDPVAIKLVRPDMARHPDVMALFKREASILHNLLHDAIPRYYVFSVEPDLQRAYIVMEFVDGVSLQNRLTSGPLSTADVRVLLKRIGGALELAHANGVVHRDISSDNIILPNGDPRRAKIVDFGIARAAQAPEGTIIGGGFAGKYKYVSPEQLGLAGGEVTLKSDIYSFGLVIAEALRGRPIDMGSNQAEVIERRKRVPDLSDIDFSLRPLLTAMLAPNPDDRPANMAEIAAWGETVERAQTSLAAPAPTPAPRDRRPIAAIAAVVVLLALAATGYALRDKLSEALAPSPSPTKVALPTLPPSATTSPSPTASPTPTIAASPPAPSPTLETPTGAQTTAHAEPPTREKLLDELSPKAAQADVAIPPAVVGTSLRAELPAFGDPGGKGLALHVTPDTPPGLSFKDLGGGRGELAGTPTKAGHFQFEVVAVNQHGKSARMGVTLTAASSPPAPSQTVIDLDSATLGSPYSAALPPFRSPERLTLRAEHLPAGFAFHDLGGGLSQLTGQPTQSGPFTFEVVAAAPDGAEGRMTAHITVLSPSPPVETTQTPVALPEATVAPSPEPTATSAVEATPTPTQPSVADFLRDFDAGPCFAIHPQDDAGAVFSAIGADRGAFQRFETAYNGVFHREPEVRATLVTQGQCAAAELLKQEPASAAAPPHLTIDSTDVGKGRPLTGAITALGGRSLLLLAIVDDGRAVKLRVQVAPGGDSASFNLPLSGDESSRGKPQVLLAIASDRPLTSLDTFRSGPSAELLPKVGAQWREAGGAAALALFRLTE